jgi:hypothetical protein
MALGSLGIIHVATIANALAHVFLQAGEPVDFFRMAPGSGLATRSDGVRPPDRVEGAALRVCRPGGVTGRRNCWKMGEACGQPP